MRCSEAVQLLLFVSCVCLSAAQFSDTPCPVAATDFTEFRPDEVARIQAACARSGLSNCGALTSQVLQGSGALNATTNEALTACQQLDPLFLLNVYKDCNFSIAADPALADNSLLTKVITSGVVPSGVIKAGQDAAAGVNKAVDGAKGAVQTVGDGARNAAQTVADGGRKAVEAVQGAFGELGRVFGG